MPAHEVERFVTEMLSEAECWQSDVQLSNAQETQASEFAAAWSRLDDRYKRACLPGAIERVLFDARGGTISITVKVTASDCFREHQEGRPSG